MNNSMSESFSEVYDVINHLDKKLYDKIPKSFINFIKSNMDVHYKVNINYNKNITEQLLYETKLILAIIYRDFICNSDIRKKLIMYDAKKIEEEKEQLRRKYKFDWDKINKKNNEM